MRRHIYIIMVMLLGCIGQLRAQDAVSIVGYEYWFDANFDARLKVDTTSTPGNSIFINEKAIDASGLSEGLHHLYIRALNSKNLWSNIYDNPFYIDREPETRPALKDVHRYRYMFNDGTMKYGELTTPGQSITDQVIADAPDVANVFIDKSATTFTFPASVEEKSEVTMTRDVEYNFALQYENDQNGWCPPVVTSFTQTQTLTKDATYIPFEKYATVQMPHRGDFQPITFDIFEGGEYALKASNGVYIELYKQVTSGETTKWVKFAEVSPSEFAEGYREYLEAGGYFGVVYTPEQYEDGQDISSEIRLLNVCATPEIIVDGDKVTIGGLEDATYYYTLDGTNPTTESTQYTKPFTVTESCIVKAIAVRDNCYNSDMAVALVNLGGDVEAGSKTARVDAKFEEGVLTLSCDTKNAIIYYGVNQTPSNIYSEPVQLTDNRPVYFYAQAPGYEQSRSDTLNISYFRCSIRAYSDRNIYVECEDEENTIYYTTDGTEPTTSGNYGYNSCGWGWYCTVKAFATAPYKLNSDTITFTPDALYTGETDYTYVTVPGSLSKAYEWLKNYNGTDKDRHAKMIKVKGVINYDDLSYIKQMPDLQYIDLSESEVVEQSLPDSIFAGKNIRYFCSPSNLTSCGMNILAGCKRIGGIKWNSKMAVPEDILGGVEYPNLMLYVKSASYANGNIFHNVISNGVAANITLQDVPENGCFFAIEDFRAQQISYTRNFTMETLLTGESQGWETLALPFNVETVTHETNGECEPFGYSDNTKAKNFWLNVIGWKEFITPSYMPTANHQFIVSMPNNAEYSDDYVLGGNVTFSGKNVTVYATNTVYCSDPNYKNSASYYSPGLIDRYDCTELDSVRIYSNYEYLDPSPERSTINLYEEYDGHNPGSVFVPGVYGCKPFEAYIEYVKPANGAPRRGPVIGIGDGSTGIKSIPMKYADSDVSSRDGKLYIYSKVEKDMPLYNIMGQLVKNVHLQVGENVIDALPAGTYLVKGKKFMINYKK